MQWIRARLGLALVGGSLFFLAGCGSLPTLPGLGPSANRSTPEGTVAFFKKAASSKNYASEWATLSPAFKKRLSRSAGRNVDLGDYTFMRTKLQENPQVKFAESLIGFASIGSPSVQGNRARLTVGALGKSTDLGLVRLSKWELVIIGEESQPYSGTIGDRAIRAEQQPDGSVVVHQAGLEPLRFQKNEIRSFREGVAEWYIDDLGQMESQFLR